MSSSSGEGFFYRTDLLIDSEWTFLQQLSETPMVPTWFAYRNVLFEMGICDSLDDFTEQMNFASLSTMDYATYPSLAKLDLVSYLVEDSAIGSVRVQFKIG